MKNQIAIIKNNNEELKSVLCDMGYKVMNYFKDTGYICCSNGWIDVIYDIDKYPNAIVFEAYDYRKFFETAKEFLIIYKNNLY